MLMCIAVPHLLSILYSHYMKSVSHPIFVSSVRGFYLFMWLYQSALLSKQPEKSHGME